MVICNGNQQKAFQIRQIKMEATDLQIHILPLFFHLSSTLFVLLRRNRFYCRKKIQMWLPSRHVPILRCNVANLPGGARITPVVFRAPKVSWSWGLPGTFGGPWGHKWRQECLLISLHVLVKAITTVICALYRVMEFKLLLDSEIFMEIFARGMAMQVLDSWKKVWKCIKFVTIILWIHAPKTRARLYFLLALSMFVFSFWMQPFDLWWTREQL